MRIGALLRLIQGLFGLPAKFDYCYYITTNYPSVNTRRWYYCVKLVVIQWMVTLIYIYTERKVEIGIVSGYFAYRAMGSSDIIESEGK